SVSITYYDRSGGQDVSLAIRKGELFSLLGVNGAGKTTLIQMLSCLVKPTDGEGAILGYDLVKEAGNVKNVIAISPQETAIAPNLTVYENLDLMASVSVCLE